MKLPFEKEESDVQAIDPAPVTEHVALCAGVPIAHAGIATRQLTRRRKPSRERRRRP